jgi:dienelactone hydrolase
MLLALTPGLSPGAMGSMVSGRGELRKKERSMNRHLLSVVLGLLLAAHAAIAAPPKIITNGPPLEGTARLEMQGDIPSALVDGADRFLLDQIAKSADRRTASWKADFSSPEKYPSAMDANRRRLAHILGLRDPRIAPDALELLGTTAQPALVGQSPAFQVFAVRWPAFADVHGEGLLLVPTGRAKVADVIAIPDSDQTSEMLVGLAPGIREESQFARRLAESGCRVLVPVLVDRSIHKHRNARYSNREYIYRAAFELGRHLIGYEVQKVLAAVDFFVHDAGKSPTKIGVIGYGDGGMLALYAGALDPRIDAVCVSGYFGPRENVWQEPLDHNVFGLLEQFGDAELAGMIAPRKLIVDDARSPEVVIPPGLGGGPGRVTTPALDDVHAEAHRAVSLAFAMKPKNKSWFEVESTPDVFNGPFLSLPSRHKLLTALAPQAKLAPLGKAPEATPSFHSDPQGRQAAQVHELERHNLWLLDQSANVRKDFFAKLDVSSLEKFQQTIEPYRTYYYDEVIGRFDLPLLPPHVRTRKTYDEPKWTGYEVVMDVFPELIAYGILVLPKDLKAGERRPVVVCQHGLEGRPQDVIAGGNRLYSEFASKLAEQGFITFAPENLYLFGDRFRSLQRKANPIKKSLFSLIVPQHQQIVDWLSTLPFVDSRRIAFYGLSYGGKSAMRIPPLVKNYCLSICSGDFNEWIWKNASIGNNYSYMGTGEYEIYEFDLGSTFNYAEMAALIAPRPFMVERGHFDGVAPDEQVAYEFAKVRFLYEAKLEIGDRCELEWFNGPHMIHGQGTYDFLHKHLNWPKRAGGR